MKKRKWFKKFRENSITFIILLVCLVISQFRDGYMSIKEIVCTDIMLVVFYIAVSLVIDWVIMKRSNIEE